MRRMYTKAQLRAIAERYAKSVIDDDSISVEKTWSSDKINDELEEKQDVGNYMTLDTEQTATAKKTLSYTEPIVLGGQETILNVLSTRRNSDMSAMWCGRMKVGNKNKTFLLGVYKGNIAGTAPICGLGAHSWNDSFEETGASWEDIYLEPDGDKAVYIGGKDWKSDSGWFKVQNSGTYYNGKVYYNKGNIYTPDWQEVATLSDIIENGKIKTSLLPTWDGGHQ